MDANFVDKICLAVIKASTHFREDQIFAYEKALESEENDRSRWVLEIMLENAKLARENQVPLCDDTGIPHIMVEIGPDTPISSTFWEDIRIGVAEGLKHLPGRPMAVLGDDIERVEQSQGLDPDPGKLVPPAFLVDKKSEKGLDVHILMLGGGPEIRALTKSIFHKRDHRKLFKEVTTWLRSEIPKLGCTPVIPAVGIGRTHFEASSLMLKAMVHRRLDQQSELEQEITNSINTTGVGSLGLGGSITALGSLLKIGPQRASGVRIACVRPCCSVEPRKATVSLPPNFWSE